MPKFIFTSKGGELELMMGDINKQYVLTDIQGIDPSSATINMSEMALNDGALFSSAKVNPRTIDVAIAITRDAEQNRLNLYRIFRPSQEIHLEYVSEALDVWLDGYVADVGLDHMGNKQVLTAQIICPYPYWRGVNEVSNELSEVVDGFKFPFAITASEPIPLGYIQGLTNVVVTNGGTVATGMRMELHAITAASNPKIYNYVTQEFIGLNISMEAGDTIIIDTEVGNKSVTLVRDGEESNAFNALIQGSTWLGLDLGGNVFTYEVLSGDLSVTFKHYDAYTGV